MPECAVTECSNHATTKISFLRQVLCEEHRAKYLARELPVYKLSGSSASKKSIHPFAVDSEPYRIRRFRKGKDKNPELSDTVVLEGLESDPFSPETLRGMGQRPSGFLDTPRFEIEEEDDLQTSPGNANRPDNTPNQKERPIGMQSDSSEAAQDCRPVQSDNHMLLDKLSEIWKQHPANTSAVEAIFSAVSEMNLEARRLNLQVSKMDVEKERLEDEKERLQHELDECRKELKRCREDLRISKKRQKQYRRAFKTFVEEVKLTVDSDEEGFFTR